MSSTNNVNNANTADAPVIHIEPSITNGNSRLLYSTHLQCLDTQQPLTVKLKFDDDNTLTLIFHLSYNNEKMEANFRPADNLPNTLEFSLKNFGSPFGTFLKQPIDIGELNDARLKMLFSVVKPKNCSPVLDLNIYMEVAND